VPHSKKDRRAQPGPALREDGILLRPAVAVPVEIYTPSAKTFLSKTGPSSPRQGRPVPIT